MHTSLGAEPEGIPEAERLNESDHHDIHLDLHAEESKHSPFEGIGITPVSYTHLPCRGSSARAER